ncbi:hypothetical protein [uncultured Tessaracoccus sp.]|uniref:hypothetical protein n=1 Tax=uncultured Tessaracoccus sp. TaxID=905023 RepID=UPI0025FAB850|nr:hypothetical protein [uncultured Tessaracoccus sp.]
MTKEIATLPPVEELRDDVPLSPRTGEPRRPGVLVVVGVLSYVAIAAIAFAYGWHWYRAAHRETYAISSHLVQWLEPEPGKLLSLVLEFVHACLAGLAGAAAGVVGFQAWNGHRWARAAAPVALTLTGLVAAGTNLHALTALALQLVATVLLFLPPVSRYLDEWERVRTHQPTHHRRPATVFYGRLPRFR